MANTATKQDILRQLQLLEKNMLLDVVSVCDANGIAYFLSSGTLLGAVRHKGFIPWDDDVDIEIPIADYRRFLEIAQEKLGPEYFVQTYITDPNYQFAYTRIRKNNTTFLNPYNRSCKMHHGVWIDVFPLVPINPGVRLTLKRKWISASNFVQIQQSMEAHPDELKELLGTVGLGLWRAFSLLPMKTRQRIHTAMLNVVFNADPNKCTHMANVWGNITTYFPKEVYLGDPQWVEFEGDLFKAPHDYIRYLEIKYGDYMTLPPEEKRRGHCEDAIIDLHNSYEKYLIE